MRVRVSLTLVALGLTMALTAAPVAAGSGSVTSGSGGVDGDVGLAFASLGGNPWIPWIDCGLIGSQVGGPDVDEYRTVVEFPVPILPAGTTVTSANLTLRDASPDPVDTIAIYGYAGDGAITAADVQVTGTPVRFVSATPFSQSHDVTALTPPQVFTTGWAGFSLRMEPLDLVEPGSLHSFDCPEDEQYPILFITYDLPNPPTPAGSLGTTDMADPGPARPWQALGFGVLLIGALATLAVVIVRRAVGRP